jgi:hypothetical protein
MKNSRMAQWIFTKFGSEVMQFEAIQNFAS